MFQSDLIGLLSCILASFEGNRNRWINGIDLTRVQNQWRFSSGFWRILETTSAVGRCSDATDENVRFLHNSLEFSYEDGWWDWTDQLFRVCSLYLIGAPIWNGNWSEILAYLKLAFLFPSRFISFLCVLFFGSATLLPRYFLNNSADGCKCNWSSKWNSFCWFPFCCSCSYSERSECLWRRHFIDPLLSFTLYQESAKNPFESPDRDYPRILRERIPMDSINISFLFFLLRCSRHCHQVFMTHNESRKNHLKRIRASLDQTLEHILQLKVSHQNEKNLRLNSITIKRNWSFPRNDRKGLARCKYDQPTTTKDQHNRSIHEIKRSESNETRAVFSEPVASDELWDGRTNWINL